MPFQTIGTVLGFGTFMQFMSFVKRSTSKEVRREKLAFIRDQQSRYLGKKVGDFVPMSEKKFFDKW